VIRVALGVMTACVVAVALYALVRGLQLMIFPEPNPATVIWSAHAGYFWRVWIVSYSGGMAGLVAWKAAGTDPARVARALVKVVVVAGVLIFAQGMLLP